jgi:signal transduction histidine kinase
MTRLQRLFSWIRGHVIVADSIITALLAVFMFVLGGDILSSPGLLYNFPTPVRTAWTIALLVPCVIRRRWPQISALAFAALVLLQLLFGPCLLMTDSLAPFMLYSVILYGNPRNSKAFIALAFVVGGLASIVETWTMTFGPILTGGIEQIFLDDGTTLSNSPSCSTVYSGQGLPRKCADESMQYLAMTFTVIALFLVSTIIIAYWQRARLMTVRMMRERNDAIAAREAEERNIAALAERARIARDMHDVVAHTLSIIIVQSDGGRYAGANDPAVARATMETIRHESERALHDMTRLLGVFGSSPHADYADIDALVVQARAVASGAVITREIIGNAHPEALGNQTSVSIYHVVQESLTNIRKYAGPKVTVHITETWDWNTLTVSITDNGRGASAGPDGHAPGYGLTGMRERIEAVGGSVNFGPRTEGGFAVCATVPFAANSNGISAHDPPEDAHTSASPAAIAGRTDDSATMRTSGYSRSNGTRTVISPKPLTLPTMQMVWNNLRSRPIAQAVDISGQRFNWVERLSQWTQRHYVLLDTVITISLVMMFGSTSISLFSYGSDPQDILFRAMIVLELTPLCVRRRFPEGCALTIAILSTLQLVIFEPIDLANAVSSICALHAAVLYGREKAWRWTGLVSILDSLLIGVKVTLSCVGYPSILVFLTRDIIGYVPTQTDWSTFGVMFVGMVYTLAALALCAGVIAMARWNRSSCSNALVLQAREEALIAEQNKQRILAANLERDRISMNIQSEVTATLNSVIDQTISGLRMLDEAEARGEEPTAESISSAFEAIGRQGREALAHMRQLLGILRETGFSDEHHAEEREGMRLRPASSLDEQMKSGAFQGMFQH